PAIPITQQGVGSWAQHYDQRKLCTRLNLLQGALLTFYLSGIVLMTRSPTPVASTNASRRFWAHTPCSSTQKSPVAELFRREMAGTRQWDFVDQVTHTMSCPQTFTLLSCKFLHL